MLCKSLENVSCHYLTTRLFLHNYISVDTNITTFSFQKIAPEPVVDEQDCRIDEDCSSLEMCYQLDGRNKCVDPCSTISPCVSNAKCRVHSTTPTRTMSCICFEGYTGNGVVSCDKISKIRIYIDKKPNNFVIPTLLSFSCPN